MKKVNLLSKAEMRKVMGGVAAVAGVCSDGSWVNAGMDICFNCCLAWHATQPASVDPNDNPYDSCYSTCNR